METLHINDRTSKNWLRPESYTYQIWWLLTASPSDKLWLVQQPEQAYSPQSENQKRNAPTPTIAPIAAPTQQQSEG